MTQSLAFRVGGAVLFAAVFMTGFLLVDGSVVSALVGAVSGGLAWLAIGFVAHRVAGR